MSCDRVNVAYWSVLYTLPRAHFRGRSFIHTPTINQLVACRSHIKHTLLRPRPFYPGLMPRGELCNDILLDLLWLSTRVYRVHRDTQPIDAYVSRCGTLLFARNEH